jgi:predicted  nucleic acid-binding Zn-ribbon protein
MTNGKCNMQCPKCENAIPANSQECPECGIIIFKYLEKQKQIPEEEKAKKLKEKEDLKKRLEEEKAKKLKEEEEFKKKLEEFLQKTEEEEAKKLKEEEEFKKNYEKQKQIFEEIKYLEERTKQLKIEANIQEPSINMTQIDSSEKDTTEGGFFSFRTMVSKTLIQIIYILGMVTLIIGGLIILFKKNFLIGLGVLFFGNLLWRIICETSILLFSIHDVLDLLQNSW